MKEKLAAIDETTIEALLRIRTEQEVILQRFQLMEEKRDLVSEEVFNRVHQDYEGRLKKLEDQAEPLKEQARDQYSAMRTLFQEIEECLRRAEMDREEIQLRHELGEFSDEVYSEHVEEHQAKVEQHQGDLKEAQAMKDRFLSAFQTEGELEEGAGHHSIPAPSGDDSEPFGFEEDSEAPNPGGGPPPIPTAVERDSVQSEGPLELELDGEGGVPAAEEIEEIIEQTLTQQPPSEIPDEATMILRWPQLLTQTQAGDFEKYTVVGGSTVLGSGAKCDIVVSGDKVAERHAEIVMIAGGHMVRDLETSVGTLVNGVEITEWKLSDGDSIQLGEAVLIFKEG